MTIKELQAIFNKSCFLFSFIFFFNRQDKAVKKDVASSAQIGMSEVLILKSKLVFKQNIGLVYYQDKPFSGVSVLYYTNGKKAETVDYINGEKEGAFKNWFQDGLLSFEAFYSKGKLNGISRSWWSNSNLRSESIFVNGIANGIQKQWYVSGEKFKQMTIVNGKEEGMQQAWRRNGKIYNNYEAKNGRIFGLKRANLCFQLEEEIVQDEKI